MGGKEGDRRKGGGKSVKGEEGRGKRRERKGLGRGKSRGIYLW